jgi:hypothetical protein
MTSPHQDASITHPVSHAVIRMRTTLDLDPSVLAAARQLATHQSISLGKAVSELALRGLRAERAVKSGRNGFPLFAVAPDSAPITGEDVARILDEDIDR